MTSRISGVAFVALAAVAVSIGIAARVNAEGGKVVPAALLVSPAELEPGLKDPARRVIDTRSKEDYAKAHIPGAVWVDLRSWQSQARKDGGLKDAAAWKALAGKLDLRADSHAVVYGSNPTDTARVWWTLKYLGLEKASILDGGWDLWAKEKRPADAVTPEIASGSFEPRFDAERLADIAEVKEATRSGKLKVLDTRSKKEFTGEEVRGKRGGHIPGATHLEWKDLIAADGRFKSKAELQAIFRERGILPDKPAACY
jgi:thiosulfate/3-mercaptopyruvate sulfurtransferase